jgi:hypothetical protein
MPDGRITYDSRRGQEVFLVVYALSELGGINGRREVIDHISGQRWYEVIGEDLTPTATSIEARYRIDLAWARKDGVLRELINNLERNAWELSRRGRDQLDLWIARFRSGIWDLHRCEYFAVPLKRKIDASYEPLATDRRRDHTASVFEYAV